MDDLIRRSDAIDEVNNLTYPSSLADVKRKLMAIPTVEPCKDAVSRKWLLNEFVAHAYDIIYDTNSHEKGMSLTGIRQVIESAPSVTAETDIDDYMKGYNHGMADTWKIAQTVFDSEVTLYEAMDVAKCMKGVEDETY